MPFRSGTIALVGRPNAGKSTLLNALVGASIAAVSDKPQTTRIRLHGILTTDTFQARLVDTPGLHLAKSELNRRMVGEAERAMADVDVIAYLADATREFDDELVGRLQGQKVVVALNKIDLLADKAAMLPLIAQYAVLGPVIPISAAKNDGLQQLCAEWCARLPEGERQYDADQLTDAPEKQITAELIREQVVRRLEKELPYVTAVEIEKFDETRRELGKVQIFARIVVEKPSQKAIVIGAGGAMVKAIGNASRKRIEELLGCRVDLKLFVAVEKDWTSNPRRLHEFGYTDK